MEKYRYWLENAKEDAELLGELESIKDDKEAINDRFYKELSFGTGGLRGVIGAGTNRLNIYTVRKATQGLSEYINSEYKNGKVGIAYDSRKNSDVFAKTAACVFAANGIKVFMYDRLMPTPMLSFAVRELSLDAGIVLTASHNPSKYNGYKVYGKDGCQITLEAANKISFFISGKDPFADIKTGDFDTFYKNGDINYISDETIETYYKKILSLSVCDCKDTDLKVVYSPLNGTGNEPVRRILKEKGVYNVSVVPEQEKPDSAFTTCPYPNPEEKEALTLAVKKAEKENADIVLATDPDCDRVGVAVNTKNGFELINGNQMGVLLLNFVCKKRAEKGNMPPKPIAIKTIVTTEMAAGIAKKYGVEIIDVLTGFKFIGEQIGFLEKKDERERFIFGFEESYGYLSGTDVRDKDAVNASMLICEMAAYYKKEGKNLCDVLEDLYREYGYFFEKLDSFTFEGQSGMEKMQSIMASLRKDIPSFIAGKKVSIFADYNIGIKKENGKEEKTGLPLSDVLQFVLENGSSVVVRPSGTEPKLKVYYSLRCTGKEEGESLYREISGFIAKNIK